MSRGHSAQRGGARSGGGRGARSEERGLGSIAITRKERLFSWQCMQIYPLSVARITWDLFPW